MRFPTNLLALGLLSLPNTGADEPLVAERSDKTAGSGAGSIPGLPAIELKTTFPDSELFGIKLVNNRMTTAVVTVENKESVPFKVMAIGGGLWTPGYPGKPSTLHRNLSQTMFDDDIPGGTGAAFNYKFVTDLHPQDLRLIIGAMMAGGQGQPFVMTAFNETVTIVEAPTSFFDPQIIFLYLVLVAAFAGTSYFIYKTWVASLFPQQRKKGSGKAASKGSKKPEPTAAASPSAGSEATAVTASTTGAKSYDESWIPAHHMPRQDSNRRKSGTPSGGKSKGKSS